MCKAYAYIRVSTVDQAENGFSLGAQRDAAVAYYEMLRHQDRYSMLDWGGFYSDDGQSAWKRPFSQREQGSKLVAKLEPGDQLIFCKLDRAFRRLKDAIIQMEDWFNAGVGVHFVDQGLNMDTANGRLVINCMTVFAQWESEIKSERVKDALNRKKKAGQPVNQKIPTGQQLVGSGNNRRFVFDPSKRPVMRLILFYNRHCGMGARKIGDRIEQLLAARDGRKPYMSEFNKHLRQWGRSAITDVIKRSDFLMPSVKPSERRKIWNRSYQ